MNLVFTSNCPSNEDSQAGRGIVGDVFNIRDGQSSDHHSQIGSIKH